MLNQAVRSATVLAPRSGASFFSRIVTKNIDTIRSARMAGMSPAALTAVMETCLPIACVINLLRGAGGALRERLIQRIEAVAKHVAVLHGAGGV
jgi:hypothetical protein